jgi:hypothetical protein
VRVRANLHDAARESESESERDAASAAYVLLIMMCTCISAHVRMHVCDMQLSRGCGGGEAQKLGAVSGGGGHRWGQRFIGLSTRQVWTALSTLRNRLSTVRDRAVGSGGVCSFTGRGC